LADMRNAPHTTETTMNQTQTSTGIPYQSGDLTLYRAETKETSRARNVRVWQFFAKDQAAADLYLERHLDADTFGKGVVLQAPVKHSVHDGAELVTKRLVDGETINVDTMDGAEKRAPFFGTPTWDNVDQEVLAHLVKTGVAVDTKDAPVCFRQYQLAAGRWFQVGDGATVCGWTDRQACTVIKRTATQVVLQHDTQRLLNAPDSGEKDALVMTPGGFAAHTTGTQRWETSQNTDGHTLTATLRTRKNGVREWRIVGSATGSQGGNVVRGRSPDYDYNF